MNAVNESETLHPQSLRYAERDAAQNVIQKILVIVDPMARTHACVEKAAQIAASYGSTIELFICDVDRELPASWAGGTTTAQYRGLMRERRIANLETLAAPLRARGLNVTTDSEWHAPLEQGIVARTIHSHADLVIKETHQHLPATRMPLARTDWILIRQIPVPLLLVRPGRWPPRPRIAVSVDPCHIGERPVALDEAMVAVGCSIGRALCAQVEMLHVLQIPPHLPGEAPSAQAKDEAYARDRAAVERVAERNHVPHCAVHFRAGRIPEGIVELVSRCAPNILVMGAVARSRFQNSAASTAAQVLEQVNCDILIVKPPGFVSPGLVSDL